jgi:DNA-binding NtrC family response regulator
MSERFAFYNTKLNSQIGRKLHDGDDAMDETEAERVLNDLWNSYKDSIERIAELETQNQRLKVIISEREASIDNVVNDILDMDNCDQDSDEMDDYWTAIKDFALITTGRCDS